MVERTGTLSMPTKACNSLGFQSGSFSQVGQLRSFVHMPMYIRAFFPYTNSI